MPDVKATIEQRAAIELRGGSLLVSAGAGSGKTWVLTQRLMGFIDPEHNGGKASDITDFLVITFTRAAAGELRSRIAEAISKAVAEESAKPDPDMKRLSHLRRQTALTGKAHISTIHSFCSDIIREFGTTAGIRADFKVIEDERAAGIRTASLNRILEKRYASPSGFPGFADLSDRLCLGRDDEVLSSLIIKLYDKLQSQAYPEVWIKEQKEILEKDYEDLAESPWGKEILKQTLTRASFWKEKMKSAVSELEEENGRTKEKYLDKFSEVADRLEELCAALDIDAGGSWEKGRKASGIEFPRLDAPRNPDDPEFKDRMKRVWDKCKKACGEIDELFAADQANALADIRATAPAIEALMDAVSDFGDEYGREKRRNALMDYSDLEHAAAQILTGPDGAATETAHAVAGRFTEIMVDEYQDVSRVQNTIFSAVSKNESNLFLVGDIKQSIYRFRLAAPEIFKERYESYGDGSLSDQAAAKRIALRDNFRSSRQIINAVNSIFGKCMSDRLGDIDYSEEDQRLKAPEEKAFDGDKPQLVIIQPPSGEELPEDLSRDIDYEAEWVAEEIRKMLAFSGETVTGRNKERGMDYSDIAILLRSFKGAEPVFRRELEKRGIPVRSASSAGFMSEPETAFIVNMLSVTDNPHKDVPLLAVLRSPVFSFSADELAGVRTSNKDADLFDALRQAALKNEKCRNFLSVLQELRDMAPSVPVTELVWKIICDNDLFAVVSAMKDGMRRRDRLLSFLECAAGYEESGYLGLHAFTEWLARLEKKDSSSGEGNGVNIMSVHRSKGLEFPVVFVCDTARRFNEEDSKGRVLFDPELGLGSELVDTERKIRYSTAARSAIAWKLKRNDLSEEMRLLYVALTRAKEKLIITGTAKNAQKLIDEIKGDLSGRTPAPELLAGYNSRLRWLIAASLADGGTSFERKVIIKDGHDPESDEKSSGCVPEPDEEETAKLEQLLRENLNMEYPYSDDTQLPSKITATELQGRDGDEEAYALPLRNDDEHYIFRMPDFWGEDKPLNAADRGTAVHLLLQHMDLGKTSDSSLINDEIERLKNAGFLTDRQAEAVSPEPVLKLFESGIGRRMMEAEKSGKLKREFRFSILADAARFFETDSGEQVLLQGVIDSFFEEEDGLVIVDYKTDKVFEEIKILERAGHYRGQLAAYAHALSRICGRRVKECVLFFLAPGKEVSLTVEE